MKRHYKKNRKSTSALAESYKTYSRLFSKYRSRNPAADMGERMTFDEFEAAALGRGFDIDEATSQTSKSELGRKLGKFAVRRAARAASTLTKEESTNLKRSLLSLTDEELNNIDLDRQSIRKMDYKQLADERFISRYYEALKRKNLTPAQAAAIIGSEIFGSD